MEVYQVFKGEIDRNGHQIYDLVATYLDREKALQHCKHIAECTPLYGDILEVNNFDEKSRSKSWDAVGWDRVTIALFQEIDIIE